MKTRLIMLVGFLALIGGLIWTTWKPAGVLVLEPQHSTVSPAPTLPALPATTTPATTPATAGESEAALPEPPEEDSDKITELPPLATQPLESFLSSALEGDHRAPPLGAPTPRPEPTPEELARPDLYQGYEKAQEEKLHRAFISAAGEQEKAIEEAITQARAAGMTAEEIAEGEEKLIRLRSVREELQTRYPDTKTEPSAPEPASP